MTGRKVRVSKSKKIDRYGISVVIPTLNEGAVIERLLKSLKPQRVDLWHFLKMKKKS